MKIMMGALALFAFPAMAGELVLPGTALERDGTVTALYRFNAEATGKGVLAVRWTDAYGRVVENREIPVVLDDETQIAFPLDLRRAVAMQNTLTVHFTLDGKNKKDAPDKRDETVSVDFVASPPERSWQDYHIIMWQQHPVQAWPALKKIGIDGGQYVGRQRPPAPFLFGNDLRWYAENIATDFYSEYHRFRSDRPVHWSFAEAKALYKQDPTSKEPFKRHPSLSDPVWLEKIRERLTSVARAHSPYRPYFYDLGDESGIADLAAMWDFDLSDHSLDAMRLWLKERYGTLDALNRQWGTQFHAWNLVTPETTNEAMRRKDENYSAWADFKEWMDVAYSRALKVGVDAVRAVDPDARVGIAGAQMPGWGGYNYAYLTKALNFFEPYDIGNNIDMIRSFAPDTPVITTAFARGPWEKHRVWYEFLHGSRGIIIWDEKRDLVNPDGSLGPRGVETQPYYTELRNGIGAQIINSTRVADPIAIHYSPASFRTDWMLRNRAAGEAWVNRTSRTERADSEFLRLRESWCRLIEDLGLQYVFVAPDQVERGELTRRNHRVLILPDSNSLSAAEAGAIADFVAQGGVVITNTEPGLFDEHSKRLAQGQLAAVRDRLIKIPGDLLNYQQARLLGKEEPVRAAAAEIFRKAWSKAAPALVTPATGVELHRFRNGGVTIVGVLTNPSLRVDELGPPEFKSNRRFEQPRTVRVAIPEGMLVYDLRKGTALGRNKELSVDLDPYEPALFALFPAAPSALELSAPVEVQRGANAQIGVKIDSTAATHVFHLEVTDPAGNPMARYGGNLVGSNGTAAHLVPFAVNDAEGNWQVRVRDILTGQQKTATIRVR